MICELCGSAMSVVDAHYDLGCAAALKDWECFTPGCEGGFTETCPDAHMSIGDDEYYFDDEDDSSQPADFSAGWEP